MPDLVERLTAALDEEEQIANAAIREAGGGHWEATTDGIYTDGGIVFHGATYGGTHLEEAYGQHIIRHDPARVLRQVEAHRKILEKHPHHRFQEPLKADSPFEDDHRAAFAEDPRYVGCGLCDWDYRYEVVEPSWWCDTVLAIAAIYGIEEDDRG